MLSNTIDFNGVTHVLKVRHMFKGSAVLYPQFAVFKGKRDHAFTIAILGLINNPTDSKDLITTHK